MLEKDEQSEVEKTSPLRKALQLTCCPGCGYTGHGFMYVEFTPVYYQIQARPGKPPLVRFDRYGEIKLDGSVPDMIECPGCGKRFPVSAEVNLEFTERY